MTSEHELKTILFFHQSTDLYGSDKVLLQLASGLDKKLFRPIVALPGEGPLMDALRESNITTHVLPLVRLSRSTLSPLGLGLIPFQAFGSLREIERTFGGIKIDIVHSNTLATLSGALWAKLKGIPHVWHVHEMITHPFLARQLFPLLLRMLADLVVCNSNATLQLLLESQPCLAEKSTAICNGLSRSEPVDVQAVELLCSRFRNGTDEVVVALVGRINRLKGQRLLVEAAELLWQRGIRNIRFLMVGGPPTGQEFFRDDLLARIDGSPAETNITIMDYTEDIWTVWDACDIAVVPSTEPEAFGMVALEAMAAGKPVVAAGHGGLLDIVADGETGFFFDPGNRVDLADTLERLARDEGKRKLLGERGRKRLNEEFLLSRFLSSFESLYDSIDRT